MDFTPELSAFQGVLLSADNVHSFTRLTARGGNEDQIEYVVKSMLKFLEQEKYVVKGTIPADKINKMRKFAFYIILNADLPVLEQMVEYDGIDNVIWTVSTISKCLMSEMLFSLHMNKFAYEAIAFSCPQLGIELASALINHIKYFTPSESLDKVALVCSACYRLICRLNFFTIENIVLSMILTGAFNHFQRCLHYFIEPPNSGKLLNMKKDEQYKFKGHCLETMLNLVHECITQFTSIQEFAPDNFTDMYQLTYAVGSYKEDALTVATCNSPNKVIVECLEKCNEVLLDKCKELVMDVSVDIFCAWSEFDENGKSMQQSVGELCYKLRSKLLSVNVVSEHPVVSMIQQISRKPVDINDIVNMADSDTIIQNIQKNENVSEWIKALIHKDKLCFESNFVVQLSSKLNYLNESESYHLFSVCKAHLDNHSENIEAVKTLAVKAFHKCFSDIKYQIIDSHFSASCFTDVMETSGFNEMLTEIFNKVISEVNVELTDILTVFLQNPQEVYTKIFTLSAESSQQTNIMLRAMALLEKYSSHYYNHDTEPCVVRVAENVLDKSLHKESMQENLIKFISGLKVARIIPENKLLLLIVMPKLHKALIDKDVNQIQFQCRILREVFSLSELVPYRAPMLAMIAQILTVVRWKIATYKTEGPAALQLALDLQTQLFNTYEDSIPANEESWLKERLEGKKMHPLNCYYYRQLWNPLGDNFVEIVSGKSIQVQMNTENLVAWLPQVLCLTAQSEWCAIWDSLSVFDDAKRLNLIHDGLLLLTAAEAANREADKTNTWECVLYCYRNFVYIIRYKFFKEPLTDEQVSLVIDMVSTSANIIEENGTESFGTVFMPLFAYLITRKDDYNVNVAEMLHSKVNNSVFKETVCKVFVSGAISD